MGHWESKKRSRQSHQDFYDKYKEINYRNCHVVRSSANLYFKKNIFWRIIKTKQKIKYAMCKATYEIIPDVYV